MSTSFSGSLPLLSTLFVFYYTDFMANKICMYVSAQEEKEEKSQKELTAFQFIVHKQTDRGKT